jgi:hypothetical protein
MSVVVTEENQTKVVLNQARLDKVKNLLGAKTESETLELALEKIIDEFELKNTTEEAEEEIDIDVHALNRIPPKKTCRVMAKVRFGGRGQPLKYDLSDYNFDEYETEE